ncbi:hypothetical protein E5288_WYG021862 [Bos mutus]|uniref:ARF7 effector protein C-terminal domain-containing protein n=1 Tax=Bos mutus TaxID=72004 RepID=A0A6B0SB17_9CETA|nr:hypothetical protein [Bos mutus]
MSEQAEKSSSLRERPARQSSPEKPSEKELKQKKRVERQLKRLSFQNPGPQVANFNPEIRQQIKKGQMAKKNEFVSVRREGNKYDKKGRLTFTCDCLDEGCLGCFYPCPKCNSTKCGPICRCKRRWAYDTIVNENGEVISKMPFDLSE